MVRVLVSDRTGAVVHVISDDHCPPNAHARHRGDGWTARVGFSYLDARVDVISITPIKNSPLQRTVNHLVGDIMANLPVCRRSWWLTKQTTCLVNQWVVVQEAKRIVSAIQGTPKSRRVESASYDPTRQQLKVNFHDFTTAEVGVSP